MIKNENKLLIIYKFMIFRLYYYIICYSLVKFKNIVIKGFFFIEGDLIYFLEFIFYGNLKEYCIII